MNINQTFLSISIQYAACPLQSLSVKGTVVNIDAIQSYVPYHPVKPFQIIIIPAAIRSRYHRQIHFSFIFSFIKSIKPGWNIVLLQVIL